jgi:iron complex outermembrane receptor protein
MRNKILASASIGVALVTLAWAEAPEVELDKIVVTPYRYQESLSKTSASVTVINQDEIKGSNAQKVIDTLRNVPGLTVRDWYGSGAMATVDIAGFGEQAALNVLVLVDGRRINDVDLSGVDWSQIPLDQVERIEVMRGGSAGVLYGDNASSGVINIITKKGSGKPKVSLLTELGSYDMNQQKLSLQGGLNNKFSYRFDIGRQATHGYRDNTYNKADDFSANLSYDLNEVVSMNFNSGFHDASYGMPSGLFQHHINENGRKWARYGQDYANNQDYYFALGNKIKFLDFGNLQVDFNYRQKDTDSYFPTSGNDTRKNIIKTFGFTPKYTQNNNIFGQENKFIVGLDYYRVIYNSDNYTYTNENDLKNYTNIRKNSIGSYLQNELLLFNKLVLLGGYRYELARYVFGYHDFTGSNPDQDSKLRPKMEAFNTGLLYNYKDDSSLFFNAGKSFRFPEVDEFTGMYDINFHQFLNTDLKPQSSINYQIGLRHKFSEMLKINFSMFRMKVKNYIYFNPSGGQWGFGENENYDKTIHQGFESWFEAKLNDWLGFFGNYTFTQAYFYGGQYDKKEIPMVPRHKAALGLRFFITKNITFNLTDTYVGKRYFINDQANAVSRLNGYMVIDTNLSWRTKDLVVTFSVNNLFDKQYSEYGVYGTDSSKSFVYDKCYFPSPGRNFGLKMDYAF